MIINKRLIGFLICSFQENPIYNINLFVLQEYGKFVELCLTVKNQWELLTGDDGVGFRELSIHMFAQKFFERKKILKNQFTFFKKNIKPERKSKLDALGFVWKVK